MSPVALPYDDFIRDLEDLLLEALEADLGNPAAAVPADRYVHMADTRWWAYLKSRFDARGKPPGRHWDIPALIDSIQRHAGVPRDARPCGEGCWRFRLRRREWYLRELSPGAGFQDIRVGRTPGGPGLPATDRMPEMMTLLDDKADLTDATIARLRTEACRERMLLRIAEITSGRNDMAPGR